MYLIDIFLIISSNDVLSRIQSAVEPRKIYHLKPQESSKKHYY